MKLLQNLILMLALVFSTANAAKDEDTTSISSLNQDISEKLPTIFLKPKIQVSDNTSDLYEVNTRSLLPYLERIIFVENLDLKRPSHQLTNQTMDIVEPIKDLGINSKSSRYIISFSDESSTIGANNENIFVSGISKDSHLNYFLVKPSFSYYHPISKEYLGTEILIIGKATVLNRGKVSLLRVVSAKEPIKKGTLILPTRSLNLPSTLKAFYSEEKAEGYILSVVPGLVYAANNSIVVLSLGARDKIQVGQLLDIRSKDFVATDPYNKNQSHVIKINQPKGQVMIYDVFNKLSLGIVLKAYEKIKVMDEVVSS